ncbi:hypothetical protein DXG01_014110 [Tephrocybe rancida]|nr:hypothetical protein DXG01_014110 [Tephrocybe rancida]
MGFAHNLFSFLIGLFVRLYEILALALLKLVGSHTTPARVGVKTEQLTEHGLKPEAQVTGRDAISRLPMDMIESIHDESDLLDLLALSRFVADSHSFLDLLDANGAVVSGSVAILAVHPLLYFTDNIDLYVPCDRESAIIRALTEDFDFTIRRTLDNHDDYYNSCRSVRQVY